MIDADFCSEQFQEFTEQRNLYESNTYGDWLPRMQMELQELAEFLNEYEVSPTLENEQAFMEEFYEIYDNMIIIEKSHLEYM